jgi:ubiquinone/menaquinone biosynthesis C-methylase UbiE
MFILNYETLIDPLLRDVRISTPGFSGMKAGDKVIDVCCGTGAQVFEYGRQGIIATGIDISQSMIERATRNKVLQKAENVFFQLADATALPFPDGSFDYATISLGLHDKEETVRNRIISEMKRVVKKDGAMVIVDYQIPLPVNAFAALARTIEFLAGGAHYRCFKDFYANRGIEDIIKNHGLREERRTYLLHGVLVASKARITG